MSDGLVHATMSVCCKLRIGSHTVPCAICTMTDMVHTGSDHTRPLARIGLVRFGTVKHANVEIPQEKPAVVTDTSESICSFITSPGIECYRGHPGIVALASCDDLALRE